MLLFLALMPLTLRPAFALGTTISGKPGDWSLQLDGQPFFIQGVGCRERMGADGTNYLALAEELGANAVRTWGLESTNQRYLDEAQARGLQVNVGIWLPHPGSAVHPNLTYTQPDHPQLKAVRKQVRAYVRRYKDHPAVMLWTLGNEVFYAAGKDAREIAGIKAFLQSLARMVKQEDPAHLVSYAAAGWRRARHLREVSAIDVVGVNHYGDVLRLRWKLKQLGETRPFILTEMGPIRPEDSGRDHLEVPIDPSDIDKAQRYQLYLAQLRARARHSFGAFVFMLGDPKPDDQTWWPLTLGEQKRLTYAAVQAFYTGKEAANRPPLCAAVRIAVSELAPKEAFTLDVIAADPDGDSLSFGANFWPLDSWRQQKAADLVKARFEFQTPQLKLRAPKRQGRHLLFVTASDGQGHVCITRAALRVKN